MSINGDVIVLVSDDSQDGQPPLPPLVDVEVPEHIWDVSDETPKVVLCCVCAHSDMDKAYVKLGGCVHVMHLMCIPLDRRCPLCRKPVETPSEVVFSYEDIFKPRVDQCDAGTQIGGSRKEQATQTKSTQAERGLIKIPRARMVNVYRCMQKAMDDCRAAIDRINVNTQERALEAASMQPPAGQPQIHSQETSDTWSWSSDDAFVDPKPKRKK